MFLSLIKGIRKRKPLQIELGQQHVVTFDENSFKPLLSKGIARKIRTWVRFTPSAWGLQLPPLYKEIWNKVWGPWIKLDLKDFLCN
jgi:hypothetical protein